MAMGPGPVFVYEWLTRSRRWQTYALRALFVLGLLFGFWQVWSRASEVTYLSSRQQLAQAGQGFFYVLTIVQIALVLVAAPAATAGAICLDKARGTLSHVMVTDLTDREVVLGKLAARLVPVLNLMACALPVSALGTLLGGIDPWALSAMFAITAGLAVLGCALALTLSVWLGKAHEVMTVVFGIWVVWLLSTTMYDLSRPPTWTTPDWFKATNPFWLALAPANVPGRTTMREPACFVLACLLISGLLAWLSVARIRPVCLAQANRVPKPIKDSKVNTYFRRRVRFWPGPSLDANPVLWREWHRSRPSRVTRIVWLLFIALTSFFSVRAIWLNLHDPTTTFTESTALINGFQVTIGLLLLSASAGTVLSEERVRGSLDVLLSTPMSTRAIVLGKWWGAFRRVPWLAFWPTLVMFSLLRKDMPDWMLILVYLTPLLIIAQGAALAGLGLALATWISRTGRAIAWTIAALVASTVGWVVIGFMAFAQSGGPANNSNQFLVILGSPFYNAAMPAILLEQQRSSRGGMMKELESGIFNGTILWTVVYGLVAVALLLATIATFDRCLGRTPERPTLRTRRRRRAEAEKGPFGPAEKGPVGAVEAGMALGSDRI